MHYSPALMHIPDGFLSVFVSLIFWFVSIAAIAYALKRINKDFDERRIPLMGVLAAAIFAGQMLNFTVVGGTSGHLVGAAIATILLGPWAAILVMTTVISVQALVFQDGGLLALGANIFNMGILGVAISYMVYQVAQRYAKGRFSVLLLGGFSAAWLSIFIASLAAALELAISGTSPANIAVPAMGGIHALIGIGEGLITVGAMALIRATRPDLLKAGESEGAGGKVLWAAGLLFALFLALISPLASAYPDGLERVAENYNFLNKAQNPLYNIIPDYMFPGISNEALATIIAGILGTLIVFGIAILVGYARRKKRSL